MPFNLNNQWATGQSVAASDMNNIANAINALVNGPAKGYAAAGETTTSTTYTDLPTTTDQVTVTIGQSGVALVFMSASLTGSVAGNAPVMSFAVSGANTIAAAVGANAMLYQAAGAGYIGQFGVMVPLAGLAAGSTTFKLKYVVGGAAGTSTFQYRRITVIPFP